VFLDLDLRIIMQVKELIEEAQRDERKRKNLIAVLVD